MLVRDGLPEPYFAGHKDWPSLKKQAPLRPKKAAPVKWKRQIARGGAYGAAHVRVVKVHRWVVVGEVRLKPKGLNRAFIETGLGLLYDPCVLQLCKTPLVHWVEHVPLAVVVWVVLPLLRSIY